jgi:hypothetical protein
LRRAGAKMTDIDVQVTAQENQGRIQNGMDDYVIYSADKPER